MQNMPAGNIDVYYHYSKKECKIYFVDAITGKDLPPVDGIEHVINNQTLTPGTKAEHFNGDAPVDPSGELYFVGWFYDKDGTKPYSFEDEIPGDTIVYAVWRPNLPTEYKIRHVLVDENGKEIKHKKGIGEKCGVRKTVNRHTLLCLFLYFILFCDTMEPNRPTNRNLWR